MFLSKSKYVAGCQCPKILWMNQHRPDQFDPGVQNQAILTTGDNVGDLAMGYFGPFVEIPYQRGAYEAMARTTQELIQQRTPVICEATFFQDGCFCMVDILRVEPDGRVHLVEVKSSTHVKPYHLLDAAFQLWLLEKIGLTIGSVSLMHLNADYVREGALNLQELFTIEDITEQAHELAQQVPDAVRDFTNLCADPTEPVVPIGPQCDDPFTCGYKGWCWRDVPTPNVHDLASMRATKAWDLHERGIVTFEDLASAEGTFALKLTERQQNQVRAALGTQEAVIKPDEVRAFLSTIRYPLYFLDFETIMPAVPPYSGLRPYQQLVTQYSLHWQDEPGGALHHTEFLADPGEDPRRATAERLVADIPVDACVLAYNMSFEKSRIRELADTFPDLREHLMAIHDNVVDLMIPFQQGSVYLPAMGGSYSIKYVLPALFPNDPELDYSQLEGVHNGGEAMDAYERLANLPPEERASVAESLLRYCELDTYAMVKILERLRETGSAR